MISLPNIEQPNMSSFLESAKEQASRAVHAEDFLSGWLRNMVIDETMPEDEIQFRYIGADGKLHIDRIVNIGL